MAGDMLIHDCRLKGKTPTDWASNNYTVWMGVLTQHVFEWAGAYARQQGGLDNIYIMCHGYEVQSPTASQSVLTLGGGLQLGNPGYTLSNASLGLKLSGLVSSITVFACGPANTSPGARGTYADGERLMGELAVYSGADVIAASQTQVYNYDPGIWDLITGEDGEIDFGSWEGPVYRFSPEDGSKSRVL